MVVHVSDIGKITRAGDATILCECPYLQLSTDQRRDTHAHSTLSMQWQRLQALAAQDPAGFI